MKKLTKLKTAILSMVLCSSLNAQVPTCPIKINGAEVYSANSFLGDKICPVLQNAKTIANGLGSSVTQKINELKTDMDRFRDVTLNDAVNEAAVAKYNAALGQIDNIRNAIGNFIKDAECGVPGAMNALKGSFVQAGTDIAAMGTIAAGFVDAFKKLGAVLPEVVKISSNVVQIGSSVQTKTPQMQEQFTKITAALEAIKKDLESLMKNDPAKMINTGVNLATGVVPYMANCAACATTLSTSIAGIGTAAAGLGGGTATSETGVGAAVGGGATAVGLVASAVSSAVSSVPCQAVFEKSNEVMGYIKDVNEFITAVANTAESLTGNAEKVANASAAIQELGKLLAAESKPKLDDIQKSLVSISETFSVVAGDIQKNVVPKISALVGNKVQQISQNVVQLQRCYNKMEDALGFMTNSLKEGIVDFSGAVTTMVDVNQVVNNLKNQLANAKTEAETSLKNSWKTVDDKRDVFFKELLGDKPADLGAVAAHFLTLGGKIGELITKGSNLASAVTSLISKAVNAGKEGFLTNINAFTASAKTKYTAVNDKSKSLAITIAKEKAKSEARLKAREASIKNSQTVLTQIKPVLTIKPLTGITSLKGKLMK